MRVSLQAGLQFHVKNKDEFNISTVSEWQGGNNIYSLGGVYKMHTSDETVAYINIGLWNRFGDAIYPYVAVEGYTWLAGITYDIVNTKNKTWAESVQSMEFSFVLKIGSVKTPAASVKSIVSY